MGFALHLALYSIGDGTLASLLLQHDRYEHAYVFYWFYQISAWCLSGCLIIIPTHKNVKTIDDIAI